MRVATAHTYDTTIAQLTKRQAEMAAQQERIASAQSGSAGLLSKKNTLTDEISRLKGERPSLAAHYAEKKTFADKKVLKNFVL